MKIKIISDVTSQSLFHSYKDKSKKIEFNFLHLSFDEFLTENISKETFDCYICHFSPFFLNFVNFNNKIEKIKLILDKLKKINSETSCLIIVNQIKSLEYAYSLKDDVKIKSEYKKINSLIFKFIDSSSSIILFDFEKLLNFIEASENMSKRNYDIMRMPYSKELKIKIINEYRFHLYSYFLRSTGKARQHISKPKTRRSLLVLLRRACIHRQSSLSS